jgi:hypothetical protein
MGCNREEASIQYVEQCLNMHVDVALLDVHLEYDDGYLFGPDIAVELRRRGFQGTIMLHSANEQSTVLRTNEPRFKDVNINGFLEKRTFQKEYVENTVLQAIIHNNTASKG